MEEKPLGQALLICKETGNQIHVEPVTPISPWPTETDEEEPATPMVLQKTFTIKMPKKIQKAFTRLLKNTQKLPRKLKKACRHIKMETMFKSNFMGKYERKVIGTVWFHTKDGYPYTKYVRRAISKAHSKMRDAIRREQKEDLKRLKENKEYLAQKIKEIQDGPQR